MHFLAGVAVAVACGLAPWAAAKVPTRWIVSAAAPLFFVVAAGAAFGLPLYPLSNAIVVAFALLAGIAVGRFMPPRFRPFALLLLVLSVIDVVQIIVFLTWFLGPRHIWVSVQFRLPDYGGFNFALALLIVIAATTENLRRRNARLGLSLLPGVIGMGLHEAMLESLPPTAPDFVIDIALSTILLVTVGYLLTELAVSQQRSGDPG